MESAVTALLWFCAIGCGLIAGLYFAFSTFIMAALARIPDVAGIAAMQAINSVILRSLFMPLFYGTTLASLAIAVAALLRWDAQGSPAMLAGGSVYVAGMFICTVALNVPLNNALAGIDGGSAESARVWAGYLKNWTYWNHIRTLASAIASVLFIYALVAQASVRV